MAGDRTNKVNELIKREVAPLINKHVANSDLFITISEVHTTSNLASARVYVVVYPSEQEAHAQKLLLAQAGRIQKELNKRLYMKRVPKLIFIVVSTDGTSEIERLLRALNQKQ